MKSRLILGFITIALSLILMTCGDDTPTAPETDPSEDPDITSKEIGPGGGEITSEDGNLTLTFPDGALPSPETITITPLEEQDLGDEFDTIADSLGIANAYELGPDGLEFDEPVTASMPSGQNAVQNDSTLQLSLNRLMLTSSGGQVEGLDSLFIAPGGNESGAVRLYGQLSHFSTFAATGTDTSIFRATISGIPKKLQVEEEINLEFRVQTSAELPVGQESVFAVPFASENTSFVPTPATRTIDIPKTDQILGAGVFERLYTYRCRNVGSNPVRVFIGTEIESVPNIIEFDQGLVGVAFNLLTEFLEEDIQDNDPVLTDPTQCIEATPLLTVMKDGTGEGTVTSDPPGIDFGEDNTEEYGKGTEVTLTATPDENSTFGGWSGDTGSANTQDSTLTVTMDSARTVTARFAKKRTNITADMGVGIISSPQGGIPPEETGSVTVEVENNGPDDAPDTAIMLEMDNGQVTGTPGNEDVTCDEPPASEIGCSFNENIPAGEVIELIFDFEAETPGTLTLSSTVSTSASDPDESNNSDQVEIQVEESTETFTLAVQKDGDGEGTVTSDPDGINLGSDGTEAYEEGTNVTLTATPEEGSVFDGWSGEIGDAAPEDSVITVGMDQDRTITATFDTAPEAVAFIQEFGLFESTQLEGTFQWRIELMSGGNSDNLNIELKWGDGSSTMPDVGEQVSSDPQIFEGQATHKFPQPGAYIPELTLRYEGAVTAEASIEYVTPAPPIITNFTGDLTDLRTVQFGLALKWAGSLDGIHADFNPTGDGDSMPVSLEAGEDANTFTAQMEYEFGPNIQFPAMPTVSVTNDASGASSTESFGLNEAILTVTKDGPGTVVGDAPFGDTPVISCGSDCKQEMLFGPNPVFGSLKIPVELTATPADGYRFVDWAGTLEGSSDCASPSEDCIKVPMNQDRTVTATFEATDQEPNDMVSLVNAPGPLMWLPDEMSFDTTPGDEVRLGVVYRSDNIGSTTFDVYSGGLQLRARYELIGSYSLAAASLELTDDSQVKDGVVAGGISGGKLFYQPRGSDNETLESQELVGFASNVPDVAVAPGPGNNPLISAIAFEDGLIQQFGYDPTANQYVVGDDLTVSTDDTNGEDFFDIHVPDPGFAEPGNSFAALTSDGDSGSLYTFTAEGTAGNITIASERQDNVSDVVGDLPVAFECAGWDPNGNSVCAITNNDGSGALVEYRLLDNPGFSILEEFTAGVRAVQPALMREGDTVMFVVPDRTTDTYVIGTVQGGAVEHQREDAPAECDGPTRAKLGPTTGEDTGLLYLGCGESEKLFRMEISYDY
ncbi:MAG: hypothetical protein GVY08_14000 [Bacteroidetes bacterium]|jgi:hypothetical protein|nr:hypothetical protein [Bacteroidota bacterium]